MAGIKMLLTSLCLFYVLGGNHVFADEPCVQSSNTDILETFTNAEKSRLPLDTVLTQMNDAITNKLNFNDILEQIKSRAACVLPFADYSLPSGVMDLFGNMCDQNSKQIEKFVSLLSQAPDNIRELFLKLMAGSEELSPDVFQDLFNNLFSVLQGKLSLEQFQNVLQGIFPNGDFLSNIFQGVGGLVNGITGGLLGDGVAGSNGGIPIVGDVVGGVVDGILGGGADRPHPHSSGTGGLFGSLASGIGDTLDAVGGAVDGVLGGGHRSRSTGFHIPLID